MKLRLLLTVVVALMTASAAPLFAGGGGESLENLITARSFSFEVDGKPIGIIAVEPPPIRPQKLGAPPKAKPVSKTAKDSKHGFPLPSSGSFMFSSTDLRLPWTSTVYRPIRPPKGKAPLSFLGGNEVLLFDRPNCSDVPPYDVADDSRCAQVDDTTCSTYRSYAEACDSPIVRGFEQWGSHAGAGAQDDAIKTDNLRHEQLRTIFRRSALSATQSATAITQVGSQHSATYYATKMLRYLAPITPRGEGFRPTILLSYQVSKDSLREIVKEEDAPPSCKALPAPSRTCCQVDDYACRPYGNSATACVSRPFDKSEAANTGSIPPLIGLYSDKDLLIMHPSGRRYQVNESELLAYWNKHYQQDSGISFYDLTEEERNNIGVEYLRGGLPPLEEAVRDTNFDSPAPISTGVVNLPGWRFSEGGPKMQIVGDAQGNLWAGVLAGYVPSNSLGMGGYAFPQVVSDSESASIFPQQFDAYVIETSYGVLTVRVPKSMLLTRAQFTALRSQASHALTVTSYPQDGSLTPLFPFRFHSEYVASKAETREIEDAKGDGALTNLYIEPIDHPPQAAVIDTYHDASDDVHRNEDNSSKVEPVFWGAHYLPLNRRHSKATKESTELPRQWLYLLSNGYLFMVRFPIARSGLPPGDISNPAEYTSEPTFDSHSTLLRFKPAWMQPLGGPPSKHADSFITSFATRQQTPASSQSTPLGEFGTRLKVPVPILIDQPGDAQLIGYQLPRPYFTRLSVAVPGPTMGPLFGLQQHLGLSFPFSLDDQTKVAGLKPLAIVQSEQTDIQLQYANSSAIGRSFVQSRAGDLVRIEQFLQQRGMIGAGVTGANPASPPTMVLNTLSGPIPGRLDLLLDPSLSSVLQGQAVQVNVVIVGDPALGGGVGGPGPGAGVGGGGVGVPGGP